GVGEGGQVAEPGGGSGLEHAEGAEAGEVAGAGELGEVLERLRRPTEGRLYDVELALRLGGTVDQVAAASGIDPWFVDQVALVGEVGAAVAAAPALTPELLRRAKRHGLSDRQVAALRPELAGEDGV